MSKTKSQYQFHQQQRAKKNWLWLVALISFLQLKLIDNLSWFICIRSPKFRMVCHYVYDWSECVTLSFFVSQCLICYFRSSYPIDTCALDLLIRWRFLWHHNNDRLITINKAISMRLLHTAVTQCRIVSSCHSVVWTFSPYLSLSLWFSVQGASHTTEKSLESRPNWINMIIKYDLLYFPMCNKFIKFLIYIY